MLSGVLELAILGLLTDEPLHGYELKRQLADTLGLASGVSFGSLYPALGRLEAAGAVSMVEPGSYTVEPRPARSRPVREAMGRPRPVREAMSGARLGEPAPRGRRGKKVYRITPAGRTLFEELLTAESNANDDDRVFALRLAFARHLPPEVRLGMLERRRARLAERVARVAARVRAGRDRLDGYGRTLAEHDREVAEHDLSWIDRLIATERAASGSVADGRTPAGADGDRPPPAPAPSISALRRPAPRSTRVGFVDTGVPEPDPDPGRLRPTPLQSPTLQEDTTP